MERYSLTHPESDPDLLPSSHSILRPQLSICIFLQSQQLAASILLLLGGERYIVTQVDSLEELLQCIDRERHQLDCLVLQRTPELSYFFHQLHEQSILFPLLILDETPNPNTNPPPSAGPSSDVPLSGELSSQNRAFFYHTAEVQLPLDQLSQIGYYIDQAITQFLNLSVSVRLATPSDDSNADTPTELTNFLMRQQRRLVEKLRERLGYLGVYYKRNPQNFWRNLSPSERQELVEQLQASYRQIVLNYFSGDRDPNHQIDEFVNIAFFADVPVTQIVEIHMELMDEFSKQLKLEGRSEEVLLDYRLTLIDTLAHLCEMYRRSIPRDS